MLKNNVRIAETRILSGMQNDDNAELRNEKETERKENDEPGQTRSQKYS